MRAWVGGPDCLPRVGGKVLRTFVTILFCAFPGIFRAVAVAVGPDDVDAVGDAIEERAGHAFVAEYLGPVFRGRLVVSRMLWRS